MEGRRAETERFPEGLGGGSTGGGGETAQPSHRRWEFPRGGDRGGRRRRRRRWRKWRRGDHGQEKCPRIRTVRAANRVTDPGLPPGSPSVRKGSGESYPDPSGRQRERRSDKTPESRGTDR